MKDEAPPKPKARCNLCGHKVRLELIEPKAEGARAVWLFQCLRCDFRPR